MSEINTGEISDGYHTFNELYEFREALNAALFNFMAVLPDNPHRVHKSRRHSDGEECFGGGWFVVYAYLNGKQISFHYPMKDWNDFKIPEQPFGDTWDGHSAQDALERIQNFNRGE